MTSLMIVELLVVLLPSSSSLCSSTLRVLWLWQCCLWLIHWVLMLGKKNKSTPWHLCEEISKINEDGTIETMTRYEE